MTRIDLGSLRMNDGTDDADGNEWWVDRLDGWDGPEVRMGVLDLLGQDGAAFSGDTYYGPRALSLEGVARIGASSDWFAARHRLSQAIDSLGSAVYLKVYEPSATKRISVRRAGRLRLRPRGPGMAEFAVPLIAADPRIYSETQYSIVRTITAGNTDSGTGQANNLGTYDSPPDSIVITGNAPGMSWLEIENVDAGRTVKLNTDIATGETITIDPQLKTVVSSVDGNIYDRVDPSTRWWFLAPNAGLNSIRFRRDAAGGADVVMTLNYRYAWV